MDFLHLSCEIFSVVVLGTYLMIFQFERIGDTLGNILCVIIKYVFQNPNIRFES